MTRSVDQIQLVGLAVFGLVGHAHGVGFDGDAAFAFEVHRIQHLRLHLPRSQRPGQFQQAIRKRGFAVVDMGNDGEIADVFSIHEGKPTGRKEKVPHTDYMGVWKRVSSAEFTILLISKQSDRYVELKR